MPNNPIPKHFPLPNLNKKTIHLCFFLAAFSSCTSLFAEDKLQEPVPVSQLGGVVVSAAALKVDTPMQDAPVSLSIVNREQLDTQQVQKLDEALRYRSGILSAPYGSDNDTDWIRSRGFEVSTYQDGNRLYKDGYYGWTLEPYGMESVEVLKGPASILYGESPPGGVVNVVTKKPRTTPHKEIEVQIGNRNHKQIGMDVGGNARADGKTQYRIVSLYKSTDGVLDGTNMERFYIAPSITVNPSDKTKITITGSIKKDEGVPTNGFFPALGTIINTPLGKIKPSTNFGEPSYDINKNTQVSLGYELEHDLNDTWQLKQNAQLGKTDLLLRSSYVFPSDQSAKVGRGVVYRKGELDSVGVDSKLIGNWSKGALEHTTLVGVELQNHRNTGKELDSYAFGEAVDIFKFEPGYYTPIDLSDATEREITKTQAGLYAQHQVKTDSGWVATVGGRYDTASVKNKNLSNGLTEKRKDKPVSLNAGVMYQFDNGLSPYASYSESYDMLTTIDPATQALYKPLEGQQIEVGVKYAPQNSDSRINIALFDLKQKNALVTNPKTWVSTQTGEVSSRGVEIEGERYLTDKLKLMASYTYTDAKTDNTGGRGRQRAGLIPKHAATAWLNYDFDMRFAPIRLGIGARYKGATVDNPASSQRRIPAQTVLDTALSYQVNKNTKVQLNINNLTNEEYVTGCDYYCYYGESRSAIASIKYSW